MVQLIRDGSKNGSAYLLQPSKDKTSNVGCSTNACTKDGAGEEAYQGKLLEARQNDYKDEFILLILSAPVLVLAWAVLSEDPTAMDKVKFSLNISHDFELVYKSLDPRCCLWYKGHSDFQGQEVVDLNNRLVISSS